MDVLGNSDLMNCIAIFLPIEDRINLRMISKQMRKFVDQVIISDLRYVQYHILGPFIKEWKIKRRYNISHQHRVVHVIMNRTKSLGIDNTLYRDMVARFYTQRLAHEVKLKIKTQDYQVIYNYGLDKKTLETITGCFDLSNYYAMSVLKDVDKENMKERLKSKESEHRSYDIYRSLMRNKISLHDAYDNDLSLYATVLFLNHTSDKENNCTCRMCIKKILELSSHINPSLLSNFYVSRSDFIDKNLKTFDPIEGEDNYRVFVDRIKKHCVESFMDKIMRRYYEFFSRWIPETDNYAHLRSDPVVMQKLIQYREKMKKRAENPGDDEDSGTESDKESDTHLEKVDRYARYKGW
jgi:hypothetical protein